VSRPEGPRRVVVTGGAGFLGRALAGELQRASAPVRPEDVAVFDLRPAPEGTPGVRSLRGDVRDAEALRSAFRGADCVIHAAARVDWGHADEAELEDVNVGGTERVIEACRDAGVPALVYTSSIDVVFGDRPVRDADESHPYPERYGNAYARTKALAEQRVLAADGAPRARREGESAEAPALRTCAVRPCGMWGEADPHHTGHFVSALRSGSLAMRIGDGRARFQHCYVGNAAHAHWLAARSLSSPAPAAAGRAYFVTDGPARNIFEFMEPVAEGLGLRMPPRGRRLPYGLAWSLAALVEAGARLARPFARFEPALTRSTVRFVCEDLTIESDRAERDLGYRPVYSEREAVERTVAWFGDPARAAS